ncbi:MAG: UPF0182 family protein [Candidatus Nitrohelix vancouverensis]|uniref:UPF0182 protein G3M78_04925 n=1 Tax=Candidatus Nitrohelix vancouverensis TaxID=2705534 RepID=A0A7T0C1E8_9BACT|nr:MAG: UPF0182 family protein [Candidatus Nitrohelix vancouverensis]
MDKLRKSLVVLAGIFFIGSIFADKITSFYIDWVWFEALSLDSVFWTTMSAQLSVGFSAAVFVFLAIYLPLNRLYNKTAHLPILLSDEVRRDVPILHFLSTNLRPIFFFGPLALGAMSGLAAGAQWEKVLQYLNAVPFGEVDPMFQMDYSFYVFTLPVAFLVKSLFWEVLVVLAIGTGLVFFLKRFLYIDGNGVVLLPEARPTFSIIAGLFFLLFASDFFLQRYSLLLKGSGVVAGITFAGDYGKLPLLNTLCVVGLIGAVICFLNIWKFGIKKIMVAAIGMGAVYVTSNLYPIFLQKFVVAPNELIKETPYIENTIAGTLKGYGLDRTQVNVLTGEASLDADSIIKNSATIENIRLWDQEPLLDTLGQIQEIRTYYQFNSIDNDRYFIDGALRQTLLSPRELMTSSLPNRTWINEHLTFTHGYGVSLSPVNEVTPEGLPVLFIKDIPPQSSIDLKVERPEIYFGELANDYVFVKTGTKEFDYPEGEKNVYKNYEGQGGFAVDSFWRKVLLTFHLKTAKIFFSNDIQTDSRVLMFRNIKDRVQKITPFLRLDNDPYLVISKGRLVWMYDAYTVSDKFPYSHMLTGFGNYIRNSVKISIDAYEGNLNYYISDPEDPIIQTYRKIFPDLFKEMSEMDEDLKSHIRYPSDLFSIQTFIYATYHMTRPQVFYNKEDQWEIPEIDGKTMEPYYTIMKLPGKEGEEYILMLPFTPRGKSNLSAWMVARSDGEHYGKLEVYTFPKQKLIYGPSQIVARINQEAEISRQISLWDQRGSRVIQGTLLVIPIEESLLYVRPLYLKSDSGKIPELKRVIVSYEDRIAMESNLDKALRKIFPDLNGQALPGFSHQEQSEVAGTTKNVAPESDEKVVLNRKEFEKIKTIIEEALAAQKTMEQTLSSNRENLETLGRSLGRLQISGEMRVEPTPTPQ